MKGAVRRAEQTIRDETATPRKPRATPAVDDAGEAGGPPADRLVEDAAAEQTQPAAMQTRTQPASDAEPETPSQP